MRETTRKFEKVGVLNLEGGKIDITDPCYDSDVWCRINNVGVKPGKYNCYVKKDDSYRYPMIKEIRIVCQGSSKFANNWKILGSIGVDAGLAGFFVSPKKDYSDEEWKEFCDSLQDDDYFVREYGFFSDSGFGDGEYDVEVAKDNYDNIVAVRIVFYYK